jgi:hypothetical protein
MPAAFPREGFRDLRERLRMAWLWAVRFRVSRDLFQAEAELGYLGWEQVEYYDDEVMAAAKKIQEFEEKQAALQNTAAELSKRKAALDAELARETAAHEAAQASLCAERAPIAARLEEAEGNRRQKLEAIGRFDRAIEEIARVEKKLGARSMAFLKIKQPTLEVRTEAREISDELTGLAVERSLVIADRERAAGESAALEAGIARLRGELERIDAAATAAGAHLAEATRRIAGEGRLLEREKKQSLVQMSHLDRRKQRPYQFIGACLADHGIAPLNQPAVLEKVFGLRQRGFELTEALAELRAARAAADAGLLIAFYLLLAAILFAAGILGWRML